ncbi:MAG TPA: efflux transporter outer membrane subunit [Patescibacteria group bacterium]|nr:efflux transporter outer membrane subunit [Patescibacteria group bacterium]
MKSIHASIASALAGVMLLSACEVGPDYERPPVEVPKAYKEQGEWKPGEPQQAATGPWWSIYQDPVLDQLEQQVEVSNQNLKAAEAAFREASAVVQADTASFFPTVTANGAASRSRTNLSSSSSRQSGVFYENQASTTLGASWVPDVWGRVRRTVEGAEASAQASAADLAGARLSAQSTLAMDYFQLRSLDELKRLLDSSAEAYTRSLQITRNQYASGIASMADTAQAETQLKTTQAQAINVGVQRAQLEHAIAVLTGRPPAEVSVAVEQSLANVPVVPVEMPSALLERRPDIAAAERTMTAANAQIGVAVAAYYPNLTLAGSYGYSSSLIGSLLQASNNIWSVGPQLAGTLFDGGLRNAQETEARATYDQDVATYRQTVLTGFQQVEDQLSTLRILAQQAEVEEQAVKSAQNAERIFLNQYRAGTVAYTSVVTAQATALAAQQTALTVHQNRLTATVSLIEALGGGWDAGQLPATASSN